MSRLRKQKQLGQVSPPVLIFVIGTLLIAAGTCFVAYYNIWDKTQKQKEITSLKEEVKRLQYELISRTDHAQMAQKEMAAGFRSLLRDLVGSDFIASDEDLFAAIKKYNSYMTEEIINPEYFRRSQILLMSQKYFEKELKFLENERSKLTSLKQISEIDARILEYRSDLAWIRGNRATLKWLETLRYVRK